MSTISSSSPVRPRSRHQSKSFTRLKSQSPSPLSSPVSRSEENTLQDCVLPSTMTASLVSIPLNRVEGPQQEDIFAKDNLVKNDEGKVQDSDQLDSPSELPEDFEDLPIELVSLIDRFIESLTARVHDTPPSIEKLSDMFQEFYTKSESHIAAHVSALSTRQSRGSPSPSISSRSSHASKDTKMLRSTSKDTLNSIAASGPEQQMLTPQEISDRRRARRLLDRKRVALQEAVERRVCERVYHRIWRHKATVDEARDEKLRSRTAALALVGIGLDDLGINFEDSESQKSLDEVEKWISKSRDGLLGMNEAKFPLGKLQQLAAAHKSIVDLLTALHQSSSSADEILPTLIYTLITSPPEGINIISNLHFIQRFRAASKVDGEAAYCLVNLEAAITFLETVDLASLRSDERLEGPAKSSSRPITPQPGSRPPYVPSASSSSVVSLSMAPVKKPPEHSEVENPLQPSPSETPATRSHQRKLSNLLQPPASALGAAGDAVRSTADHGLKTISSTLDSSFNLLFGRLREQKVAGEGAGANGTIIVPKTLDDARKLVEPKDDEDEGLMITPARIEGYQEEESRASTKSDDSLLSAIAGRKQPRERSVDTIQISGSGTRVAITSSASLDKVDSSRPQSMTSSEQSHSGNGAVESLRNLGNTFNPLRSFGGLSVRGFGRNTSSDANSSGSIPTLAASSEKFEGPHDVHKADGLPPMKTLPPVQRFLQIHSADELKLGDVTELLSDYKRLAGALKDMGAF